MLLHPAVRRRRCTRWKLLRGRDADEAGHRVLLAEELDHAGQGHVGQAVGVVGEEHLLALEVAAAPRLSRWPMFELQPGVDEGDLPVVDVAGQQLDRLAAVGQHEVVGDGLVVVEEVAS